MEPFTSSPTCKSDALFEPLMPSETPLPVSRFLCSSSWREAGYHPGFTWSCAIVFTLGKIIQTSGVSLFGVEKTFEAYGWTSPACKNLELALTVTLIITSALATIIMRAVKNFQYFLTPNIYYSKQKQGVEKIKANVFRKIYIISDANNELTLVQQEDFGNKPYKLPPNAAEQLEGFIRQLSLENSQAQGATRLILSSAQLLQFLDIKKEQQPLQTWSRPITGLFWMLYIFGILSAFFSTLGTILASQTLADHFKMPNGLSQAFILFISCANLISYCTFTLAVIKDNIQKFCNSVVDGSYWTSTLSRYPALGARMLISLGMFANLGLNYFSTRSFFELCAAKGYCPNLEPNLLLLFSILNLGATFTSGIFNLVDGVYKMIQYKSQGKTTSTDIGCTMIICVDTAINLFSVFLGVNALLYATLWLLDIKTEDLNSRGILMALAGLVAVCYGVLVCCMMRRNTETFVRYIDEDPPLNALLSSIQRFRGYAPLSSIPTDEAPDQGSQPDVENSQIDGQFCGAPGTVTPVKNVEGADDMERSPVWKTYSEEKTPENFSKLLKPDYSLQYSNTYSNPLRSPENRRRAFSDPVCLP